MKKNAIKSLLGIVILAAIVLIACQDLENDRPTLGSYPKDVLNDTSLVFYLSFDDETAKDSKQEISPTRNDLSFIDGGISGKALQGADTSTAQKFIEYSTVPSEFGNASSFTIAFWMKHDGIKNQPEFIFSIPSTTANWSGAAMFLLFETAAIKFVMVDSFTNMTWLNWETATNDNPIPNLIDSKWHHVAFIYDETTSKLTLYKDGEAYLGTKEWTGHGAVNLDYAKITGMRIASGQGNVPNDWRSHVWTGQLDQFRIYSAALSAFNIKNLYRLKK